MSTENLIATSPDSRRRSRALPKESVGEHLRRKLMKVAHNSSLVGESEFKENRSPNVNASGATNAAFLPGQSTGNIFVYNSDVNSTNGTTFVPSCPTLADDSTSLPQIPSRISPKHSIGSSTFQNLLQASKKSSHSTAAGKLSLLAPKSSAAKRFSYEKLDDGVYYQGFSGIRDVAETNEGVSLANDRIPSPVCCENEYVEPRTSCRDRPPCLLPWETSEGPLSCQQPCGQAQSRPNYLPLPVGNASQNSILPSKPNPGGFSSLNSTAPESVFPSPYQEDAMPRVANRYLVNGDRLAPYREDATSRLAGRPLANGANSPSRVGPRALRNRMAGAGGRKLRRRHSMCAAAGPMLGPLVGPGWPMEDREADVSADQSGDEDDEDSEFG